MRLLIWITMASLGIGITTYSVGKLDGYQSGYDEAMADVVLGIVTPETYVKKAAGIKNRVENAESNGNDRASH